MKKLIALVLCLAMLASLSACGVAEDKSSIADETPEETPEETAAGSIWGLYYTSLQGMKYIRNAWKFSIDHSTDDTMEELIALFGLIKETLNTDNDELVEALVDYFGDGFYDKFFSEDDAGNKVLKEIHTGMIFMQSSPTVYVAQYLFEKHRTDTGFAPLSEMKERAKEDLKAVDEKSDAYETLKSYYFMAAQMVDWVTNPSGTYNDLENGISQYEKEGNQYLNELNLLIDYVNPLDNLIDAMNNDE